MIAVAAAAFTFGGASAGHPRAVQAGSPVPATDDYQAVELPYRGGRFAALAVMPTRGSLSDFVDALTPNDIAAIAGRTSPGLTVSLPRFTTTSKIDLKPVLNALGMRLSFTDRADFAGVSARPRSIKTSSGTFCRWASTERPLPRPPASA